MHYVYVLQSTKDGAMYTGCTNDLKKRFAMHNAGTIDSTRMRRPLKLVYYEAFASKHDAFIREKYLKTGWGRRYLRKVLANALAKN